MFKCVESDAELNYPTLGNMTHLIQKRQRDNFSLYTK